MMMATILHNPRCSKSREALAILEAAGAEVTVIDYLKAPPSAADLKALYARAGMTPREGLRTAETGAKALTHRSEEHTSELQSLMRISYAVFCLKKKKKTQEKQQLH